MTTLLVPIDFSVHALTALRLALGLGRERGTSLTLLHVDQLPGGATPGTPPPAVRPAAWSDFVTQRASGLALLLAAFRDGAGASNARIEVVMDEVSTAIINRARMEETDLIVMGSHGPGAEEVAWVGSVAAAVCSAAPCPVLVARASHAERVPADGRFRRVAIIVDDFDRLAALGPKLALLLAADAAVDLFPVWAGVADDEPDAVARRLQAFAAEHLAGGDLIAHPAPSGAGELLGHLERAACDLAITTPTAGEPAPSTRHLGLLTERLLFQSPSPLLVATEPPDEPA